MSAIDYYNENAKEYFDKTFKLDMSPIYSEFLSELRPKDRILDVGCGSGRDSKYFLEHGYDVVSIDGSFELAKLASAYIGKEVIVRDF